MSEVRIIIQTPDTAAIPPTQVNPIWSGEVLSVLENNQVFYRKKFTQLKFKDADHCLIQAAADCDKIEITIEEKCDGEWREYVRGKFTHYDCEFDLDHVYTLVTPTTIDLYTCFLDEWETEQNIYNCSAEVSARGVIGTYQAGLFPCYQCRATADISPCNDHTAESCVQFSLIASYPSPKCAEPNRFEVNTAWHREVGVGTSTTPPPYGTGWTLLTGFEWWRCPDSAGVELGVFRYGRAFQAVISYLMEQYTCGIVTRSHFFDILAEHTPGPPGNTPYTFADDYLQNITLHQKSDVKRPDADKSFSKVWVMKAKDLLDDLRETMNLYWYMAGTIEAPELIIEHISFFDDTFGLDVSSKKIRRRYKQDDQNSPKKETWKWSDDTALNFQHAGYPIEYTCGGAELEHRVKLFTNDVVNVKASVNAENISDKNFVLLANYLSDTGQRLIFGGNNPLGFLELHDNLHRHNRYFEDGRMNNAATTFTTFRKTKRLKQFSVAVCCDQNFNPADLVTTSLGPGRVAQAAHNLIRNKVKLDLLI